MTVIETHPEELLDRELRGTLTDRERHLLMAHLQRCSACRMERQLRVDFERELAVSAQSLDLQMFVSDAIDAMEQLPGAAESLAAAHSLRAAYSGSAASQNTQLADEGAARIGWTALRPVAVLMLVCVALSAGVGIGAAQLGLAERAWQLVRAGMDATFDAPPVRRRAAAAERPEARAPVADRQSATPPAGDPASAVQAEQLGGHDPRTTARVEVLARELEASPAPHTALPLPAEKQERPELAPVELRVPGRAVTISQLGASAAARPTPSAASPLASAAESVPARSTVVYNEAAPRPEIRSAAPLAAVTGSESAGAPVLSGAARLFDEANRIRHRGQAPEASALYRELQARYPSSAEARLSMALVARMQLDQGESAAALAGFESYLSSSDTALREEAMVGRVRALSRLGREEEARGAAQILLAVYPSSAFAPAARKLLEPPVP